MQSAGCSVLLTKSDVDLPSIHTYGFGAPFIIHKFLSAYCVTTYHAILKNLLLVHKRPLLYNALMH